MKKRSLSNSKLTKLLPWITNEQHFDLVKFFHNTIGINVKYYMNIWKIIF